jgi:hypothetical protein
MVSNYEQVVGKILFSDLVSTCTFDDFDPQSNLCTTNPKNLSLLQRSPLTNNQR